MVCPKCKRDMLHVVDSRALDDVSIHRRRECLACGNRFNTTEISVDEYERLERLVIEWQGVARSYMNMSIDTMTQATMRPKFKQKRGSW